jgi:hypothetical protein
MTPARCVVARAHYFDMLSAIAPQEVRRIGRSLVKED